MAFNVTINAVDDEDNFADVTYEDTSSGVTLDTRIYFPVELADEEAVLDFVAGQWPGDVFTQRGKPQAERHVEAKSIIGVKKNITSRVMIP